MNKNNKDNFNRSDIEKSLRKEFPNLTKFEISDAIDSIINSIIETVALDEKWKLEALELSKNL